MAMIYFEISKTSPILTKQDDLGNELGSLCEQVENVKNNLRNKISAQKAIDARLRQAFEQIQQEKRSVLAMRNGYEQISSQYIQYEKENLSMLSLVSMGSRPAIVPDTKRSLNPLAELNMLEIMLEIEKMKLDAAKEGRVQDPWSSIMNSMTELFKKISPFSGFWQNRKGSAWFGGADALLSVIKNASGLKDSENGLDLFSNLMGYMASGCKLDKKVLDLLKTYGHLGEGNKDFLDNLGLSGACFNLVESIVSNYQESEGCNPAFWKNSSGITSKLEKFIDIYFDGSGKWEGMKGAEKAFAKYNMNVKEIAPAKAAIDMGIYFLADIFEKTEDGKFDMADYGSILRGTGATGANTLISAATLGLISPDVEDWDTNFREAQQFTYNVMDQWNIQGGARTGALLISSIPVAAYTAAKTVVDEIGETVGKIADGVSGFINGIFGWMMPSGGGGR